MKNSTRVGIMAGFMAILLITIFDVASPKSLVEGWTWLTQLIYFGAIVYGLNNMRETSIVATNIKELSKTEEVDTSNDFIGLSELVSTGFRIYFIGFIMTFLYVYVLFNYIDPSLVDLVEEATVRLNIELKNPAVPDEIFQGQIKALREEDFSPKLTDFFSAISFFQLGLGFVVSFIVALVLRREKPAY